MDNVNNLNRTSEPANRPTQEPISLTAFSRGEDEPTSAVTINTTNGLTGATPVAEDRPVVRINTSKKANRSHRTVESVEDLNTVDPNDYIPKVEKEPTKTPRDVAMSQLDAAVHRKQDEYKAFINAAIQDDQENREKVENGLEEVGGELQYMPNELHVPIAEEEKIESIGSDGNFVARDEDDDDELIGDVADSWEAPVPSTNIQRMDLGYVEETKEEEEAPVEEAVESIEVEEVPVVIDDNEVEEEIFKPVEDVSPAKKTVEYFDTTSVNITSTIPESADSKDFADIEAEDFEDVTVETEENLTDEQIIAAYDAGTENLKKEIFEKIISAGKKLNTSQFVVSTKVVSLKDALRGSETEAGTKRTASWPMVYAGRPYVSTALRGPEIAMLADFDDSDSDNGIGLTREQAKIMFEHDANPYRPLTLEAWAKTIPFHDIDSIFAAMYVASLKGSNYMPFVCQKTACQHAYLSDDINIESMVKFNSDEAKERFNKIKETKLTPQNTDSYESVVSVINDRFAIGIKLPSIYTILYEQATLNMEFLRKHQAVASIMQYVDYIYLIDPDTSEFKPIGWKTYPGDPTKTYKSKIATYAKIFAELDGTDFGVMISLINSMVIKANDMRGISYEIPSTKCPKCGSEIAAQPITPRSMVFTRQRLVALATTPTEK